ncbi:hypothetical protein HY469_02325 [Candidatus Roizmanbacteria bacterium]|nr:hypothetical protein [Candidatus Roizmanbacteria bacterium]
MQKQPARQVQHYSYSVDVDIRAYRPVQFCPVCSEVIGALAGSRDAICKNCGYKDPCCE